MGIKEPKGFIYHLKDQSGNATLIGAIAVAGASLIGIQVMMERNSRATKAVKMDLSRDEASQLPRNSAILAKALVSVPEGSIWETTEIVKSAANLPPIYVDPYFASGKFGEPISPESLGTLKTMNPPADWSEQSWSGLRFDETKSVIIKTTDGSQMKNEQFESLMASPGKNLEAMIGTKSNGSSQYPKADTTASYSIYNCDAQGKKSSAWSGEYCAKIQLTYKDPVAKSGNTMSKASAELGLIAPPPKPVCHAIKVANRPVKGTPLDVEVDVTGVVVGYKIAVSVDDTGYKFPITAPASPGPVYTNANQVGVRKTIGTVSVPTNQATDAQLPPNSDVTIEASVTGANGEIVDCPVLRNVPIGTPSCQIAVYDDQIYNNEDVGALIGKPHQNRELYIAVKVTGAAGYLGRLTLDSVTNYGAPFSGDSLGLVVPTDGRAQPGKPAGSPPGWYMYKAVITGNTVGKYGIVGHILDPVTKGRVAQCVRTGDMAGQWLPSVGNTPCVNVCGAKNMVKAFDRGGSSCLSGENFYNRAYGSLMKHNNDVLVYYRPNGWATMTGDMWSLMGKIWGGNGDMEKDNLARPDLQKQTLNEGGWCYWVSRKTTFAQCAGTTNDPWTPGACQKFDGDSTDTVKACYCANP